jgi:hypothetical protein
MTAVAEAHQTRAAPTAAATAVVIAVVIADALDDGAGAVVVVVAAAVAVRTMARATLLRSRTLDRGAIFLLPNTRRPPGNRVAMTAATTVVSSPVILNPKAATIAETRIAEIAAVTVAVPRAALNRAVVSHAAKARGTVRLPLLTIRPKNRSCFPVSLSPNIAESPRLLRLLRNALSRKFTTNRSRTAKISCPTAR